MIYQLNDAYYVRALRDGDVDGPYPSWFEDQETSLYSSHGKFPKSDVYFREYVADSNREDRVVWAICHAKDGHIGNISLQEISALNRTAEYAILLGDRRHRGKGVALLASMALLGHGFDKLNLERIYCGTAATNEGMKKLAVALGMRLEGTRRSQLFLEGRRVDLVEYGILREEFDLRRTR